MGSEVVKCRKTVWCEGPAELLRPLPSFQSGFGGWSSSALRTARLFAPLWSLFQNSPKGVCSPLVSSLTGCVAFAVATSFRAYKCSELGRRISHLKVIFPFSTPPVGDVLSPSLYTTRSDALHPAYWWDVEVGCYLQVQAVVLAWDKIQTEDKAETNKNQLTNKTQPKPNQSSFLNPNGDGISTGGALK